MRFRTSVQAKILTIISIIFISSGCALQYVDNEGNHNTIGFVNIKSNTNLNSEYCTVENIEVTTFGISGINMPSHGALTLGYSTNTTKIIQSTSRKETEDEMEN
ncbi:hypothetical protein [Alteromonas gracilis]|uniref:Lipoprotein n=1 Tax=Alteromonas gracilis TaxID=1479524 RepID=A0ABX5CNI9_9ALTE|nr:hypothetical protein [Alteromonas gracilis]PRO68021.1 hypothetical protein C6Y39_15435 [Alteromonas gracilis]